MYSEHIPKNAKIDHIFEEIFDKNLENLSESERAFCIIHKYPLAKLFISKKRKDIKISKLKTFFYLLSRKGDSYLLLLFKINLNLIFYFFFHPIISFCNANTGSKTIKEINKYNKNYDKNNFIYPSSIQSYLKNFKFFKNFISFNMIIKSLKDIKIPRIKFIFYICYTFSGKRFAPVLYVSTFITYIVYSYSISIVESLAESRESHTCMGAVIAPQKIFSLIFIKQGKSTAVHSHGIFHDIRCADQPCDVFIPLFDNEQCSNMHRNDYFDKNNILNKKIDFNFKERANLYNFETMLSQSNLRNIHDKKILIFSSMFDPGIARDPFYGLMNLVKKARIMKFKSIYIKLHPAESKIFFQLLHLLEFGFFAKLIEHNEIKNYYDIAVGLPSTIITELNHIEHISVLSPLYYPNYDYEHDRQIYYLNDI